MSTVVTDRETYRQLARPGVRVPVERRLTVTDPFVAYQRAREETGGVFLETTGGQNGWGYFATDPEEWLTVDNGESGALDQLLDRLSQETLVRGDCDVPYPCGAFGWLSYDIARDLESLPETTTNERALPRLEIGIYPCVAAWKATDDDAITLRLTACPHISDGASVDAAYDRAVAMTARLESAITNGDPSHSAPPATSEASFTSECGRGAFIERVERVKESIRDGNTFQANISQRLRGPASVHPVAAYESLRRVNPAPYSGLLEFPSCDLVSASPELLLERDGDRLRTEPIAGTRPRGETPEEDERLAETLTTDDKERAEHAMLVDLERNDLGKVSEYGSVEVTDYRRIDRYSEVMHLVSEVEGTLRADCDLADAIAAVFPGGTITGAPKPETMAIIDEVERSQRGPYTGSMGIFGFDDRATLNIVIRTLVRSGSTYTLRVGAGIVHDSVPDQEYEETLAKGKALLRALELVAKPSNK